MNTTIKRFSHSIALHLGSAILLIIFSQAYAGTPLSQSPLVVSGGAPDNLVLVPSVEYPTINSVANIGDSYSHSKTYVGYFDADKCYAYSYSSTESERHFYPVIATSTIGSYQHSCPIDKQYWSGNFLNWAATQTIDPFRSSLTGGYRVKDEVGETWLEKARSDGQGSYFPNRRLPSSDTNSTLVKQMVPFDHSFMQMRINGLGNKMYFSLDNSNATSASSTTAYNPSSHTRTTASTSTTYQVNIRVKVCVPGLLEDNCVQYGAANYKPEGLLQEYSGRLRYSVFGYLNDSDTLRDGAVLRAKQKSIGPFLANLTSEVEVDNPNKEWDPTTGVFIRNPDPTDANTTNTTLGITSVQDSGVINYINKFGQMTTAKHKSYDPVSEMYYAAVRYLRNQSNVNAYSTISSSTSATDKYKLADGFPIITNWVDPYLASCQATAILGIGDANTHKDKNLPGNTDSNYRTTEPAIPTEVSNDLNNGLNVVSLTNKIGNMEGLGNIGSSNDFSGRNNSAYIAGLAWYANTMDLRTDSLMPGKQTAATYWVDVLEDQVQKSPSANPYILATKYGGFAVPPGETFDPTTWTGALPLAWYNSTGQSLTSGGTSFKRPDNYFTAKEAEAMTGSLKQAFNNLTSNFSSTGASLASVSSKLTTGNRIYQTVYFTRSWNGDIFAFDINPATGKFSTTSTWRAANKMPAWDQRNIRMSGDRLFQYSLMLPAEQSIFGNASLVDYLRGDRSKEYKNDGTGNYRKRASILGDMIQSQAIVVGKSIDTLYAGMNFTGAASHATFASAKSGRNPTLYIGGNDGMLHAFDAVTGVEVYAFVPSTTMTNMPQLSDKNYTHRYFVDGELTAADVFINNQWKTVLVGSFGRGGKGLFALDITDPSDIKYLWEVNATTIPALGNTLGKPLIVQTADGVWQVVVGNGPNSASDKAHLVLVNLETVQATIINTNSDTDNALTSVSAWSENTNGIATDFYAGDIKGNIWRFKVGQSTPTKLFTAKDANNNIQPISAAPTVGRDPLTNKRWVFFGTGRFWIDSDVSNIAQQTWYGIQDEDTLVNRSELKQRHITHSDNLGQYQVRVIETGTMDDLAAYKGWYIELKDPINPNEPPASPKGERMVVPNFFQGDTLIGTTKIPSATDVCTPTGSGFIMAINPFPGARLDRVFFDINDDDKFDNIDKLEINNTPTIISGIGFSSSPHNPIFIDNLMEVVSDNGSIQTVLTQGFQGHPARTSWREIINQ